MRLSIASLRFSLRKLVCRPVLHLLRNRFSTHFDFSFFLQFDFTSKTSLAGSRTNRSASSRSGSIRTHNHSTTILRTTLRSLRKPLRKPLRDSSRTIRRTSSLISSANICRLLPNWFSNWFRLVPRWFPVLRWHSDRRFRHHSESTPTRTFAPPVCKNILC